MTDVLASPDGTVRSWKDIEGDPQAWEKQIPVFFSNPDLLWVSGCVFSKASFDGSPT